MEEYWKMMCKNPRCHYRAKTKWGFCIRCAQKFQELREMYYELFQEDFNLNDTGLGFTNKDGRRRTIKTPNNQNGGSHHKTS